MMQGVVLTSGISQPNWSCEHECKWSRSVHSAAVELITHFRNSLHVPELYSLNPGLGYLSKRRMTVEYQVAQQI